MGHPKSKICILIFLSNVFWLSGLKIYACSEQTEPWEIRIMLFRAQLPGMEPLQRFRYTLSLYNYSNIDPQQNDRQRNCREWQLKLGQNVELKDIYTIQYKTLPAIFIEAYQNNNMDEVFPENTFIKQLSSPQNKDLMSYMLFAKKTEALEETGERYFEEWNNNSESEQTNEKYQKKSEYYTEAISQAQKTKDVFLRERYAFQICRLAYQMQLYNMVAETYDTYFETFSSKSLMNIWALFFKAMSIDALGRKNDANYLYSLVFDNCDEKKMRCIEFLNKCEIPAETDKHKQSVLYAMHMMNFPGRTLDTLCLIHNLDNQSSYLPFLIQREVNKLENWILTPGYYPNHNYLIYYYWGDDHKQESKSQWKENLQVDLKYLKKIIDFVNILKQESSGEKKDYYNLVLAHLSLLDGNSTDAQKYLTGISSDPANPSICIQRDLDVIWLAMKTQDITQNTFKELFIAKTDKLRKLSVEIFDKNRILYSLTQTLSAAYFKKGDKATAGLLQMKSDNYFLRTDGNEDYYNYTTNYINGDRYYKYIQEFDDNASPTDIDVLITLINKKDKTSFEKYLCDQHLASIDAYKDLKGTIAFRENDWQKAYETFASMPQDFWNKTYAFSAYLCEDPFLPKGLYKKRDFTYKFNKTDFVRKLIELKKEIESNPQKRTENYIQLGNALYNCSFCGNSWMMVSYGQNSYYYDIHQANLSDNNSWKLKNYFTCKLAKSYYLKALESNANNEQKAFANLMLYWCNFLCYPEKENNPEAKKYALEFYNFKDTKTFQTFDCPGIKNFIFPKKNS